MYYIIQGTDVENSLEQRMKIRPIHLERLQALKNEGRLLCAGPIPAVDSPEPTPAGFLGSLVIAEFASLEDAQAWANADPYLLEGVYSSVKVTPYIVALP